MDVTVTDMLIDLIMTACVIIVFSYVITRIRFFSNILEKQFNFKNRLILIVLFGAFSIFGTYGGVELPSGSIANIRDLGPMIAGLLAGPVVGLGAGLIGGVHRYFLGGLTYESCALATIIAGLMGGVIYELRKGEFPKVWQAALFATLMEIFHLGLALLITRPFDEALDVVKTVGLPVIGANAIGIAIFAFIIHNLIMERKTAAEKDRYRWELEKREFEMDTARHIQQSFLPETPPIVRGFDIAALSIPAREVGGDFYDFIPISQDKWGIVVADVAGKGVPAALFMALSRTFVRANVVSDYAVTEAIERANNLIAQDAKSGMFVTLFYAVLDSKEKRLKYANAGHNPPLLFKGNTGNIVMLEAKGIALGVLDDIKLEEREIELTNNDIVILYTDGVTEAINLKEEQFGKERLIEVIGQSINMPPHNMIEKIKGEVAAFASGQPQFDDFTLVILRAT